MRALFLSLILVLPVYAGAQDNCKVCERIELFSKVKLEVGRTYWPGLSDLPIPLIYFDDSTSFVVYSKASVYTQEAAVQTTCKSGLRMEHIPRLDKVPFYMQNKTDYSDTASPYYYNPTMFCSDPEALRRVVPEFTTTEHWLQLLMHEYFHAFELSHDSLLAYFGRKVKVTEDSLDRLYQKDARLASALQQENASLLAAINSSDSDSVVSHARHFLQLRAARRARHFRNTKLASVEDFWEKMEGPARYVEYYMGLSFPQMNHQLSCDTMFREFAAFKGKSNLEETEVFAERTKISPAYYYATGFNLCRLLDRLRIPYKDSLFIKPDLSLTAILNEGLKTRK